MNADVCYRRRKDGLWAIRFNFGRRPDEKVADDLVECLRFVADVEEDPGILASGRRIHHDGDNYAVWRVSEHPLAALPSADGKHENGRSG